MAKQDTTSPVAVTAAARRLQALSYRRAGHSYTSIGDLLKVNRATAYKLVKQALEDTQSATEAEAQEHRALECERLDAMQRAVWPAVLNGHLGAVDRALRISERRARLLGLDAPTKIAPTDPTGTAGAALTIRVEYADTNLDADVAPLASGAADGESAEPPV